MFSKGDIPGPLLVGLPDPGTLRDTVVGLDGTRFFGCGCLPAGLWKVVPTAGLAVPTPGLVVPTPGLVVPTPGLVVPTPGLVVTGLAVSGRAVVVGRLLFTGIVAGRHCFLAG